MKGKLDYLFDFIRNIGALNLENGGETSMIEEAIERVLVSYGCIMPNVYVTPTGIFYSFTISGKTYNDIIRVKQRDINLTIIDDVNNIVRRVCSGKISIEDGNKECIKIKEKKYIEGFYKVLFSSLSAMFFTLLFGGSLFDCVVSFGCGFIVSYLMIKMSFAYIGMFFNSFVASSITAMIAILFSHFFTHCSFDKIVTGAIMPLLPGLALTNSLKDTLTGNLVSGISRLGEVILVALSIAGGIGLVMYVYLKIGGVL